MIILNFVHLLLESLLELLSLTIKFSLEILELVIPLRNFNLQFRNSLFTSFKLVLQRFHLVFRLLDFRR